MAALATPPVHNVFDAKGPGLDDIDADHEEEEQEYVITRDGKKESVDFGKIGDRIKDLTSAAYGRRLKFIKRTQLIQQVIARFKSGMTTLEIDKLVIDVCRAFSNEHPDYSALAARIQVSNLQKSNQMTFQEIYEKLYADPKKTRMSPGFMELVREYGDEIEDRLVMQRDFNTDGFAISTQMRSYLLKDPVTGEISELPQHMYMRVSVAIFCLEASDDQKTVRPIQNEKFRRFRLDQAFRYYDLLSQKKISHASPTIFNAGTTRMQLSSCFLTQVEDDFYLIFDVLKDVAMMSKNAGGVALDLSRVRSEGTYIQTSGGKSQGLPGLIPVLNNAQRYSNQGDRRPGAWVANVIISHPDIFSFLEMALPKGPRYEAHADGRFLKYCVAIPDLFMRTLATEIDVMERKRNGEEVPEEEVKQAGDWYLFDPKEAPHLDEVYDERSIHHPDGPGGSYTDLYMQYVEEGRYRKVVKASDLMRKILHTLSLVGNPYMLFLDNMNRLSNLSVPATWGTEVVKGPDGEVRTKKVLLDPGVKIVTTNLCTEITIPPKTRESEPDKRMYSVCTLSAMVLPNYIVKDVTEPSGVRFDFVELITNAGESAEALDNVIDLNYPPAEGCRRSNNYYRPIGIGIIGLHTVFHIFGYEFGSPEALALDAAIHACIYYGAMYRSSVLAETRGNYPAHAGSKAAKGLTQPDIMCQDGYLEEGWEAKIEEVTGCLTAEKWQELRDRIRNKVGPDGEVIPGLLRNGYVTADMPTATSANAAAGDSGNMSEGICPPGSFMYPRKTLSGEFIILDSQLIRVLQNLKIWGGKYTTKEASMMLEADEGSIASWDGTNGRPFVPEKIRAAFQTARELNQNLIAIHARARQSFLSQSQSLNTFWKNLSMSKLLEYWLTAWIGGAVTGSYYCHAQAAKGTQKANVDRKFIRKDNFKGGKAPEAGPVDRMAIACPIDPALRAECEACSV